MRAILPHQGLSSNGKCLPFCRQHFQTHFRKGNYSLIIQMSLTFVSSGLIVNIGLMAWLHGDKPLHKQTMTHWIHDDVIKWKHFPRNWPFVRGIHRSPVNSPHKGQWRGALMFSLIYVWINDWVNNPEAGDLRRYRAHSDVIVMLTTYSVTRPQWGKLARNISRNSRRGGNYF